MLSWLDYALICLYVLAMLGLGLTLGRYHLRRTEADYFLASRRTPWLAAGVSVMATMMSSITYLAEPGEVWKSGTTHVLGKLLGIPLEMLIVWGFCIPFMMRFQFTSAYQYLGLRFGRLSQRLGVALFVTVVLLWMGVVVSVLSQVIHQVTGIPLIVIVLTTGLVATCYTMMGGLRAVIWTDVVQVVLMVAGAGLTVGFICWETGSWLPDWLRATEHHLRSSGQPDALPWFSWDPTMRATVVTVAINMAVWHVCVHTSNQMVVQRYLATSDVSAARRGFVTSACLSVAISLLLLLVGMAVLYYTTNSGRPMDGQLDPERQRDLIFPMFAVCRLPAGAGGAVLVALLAAAMSTLDSGVNSVATVVWVEWRGDNRAASNGGTRNSTDEADHVRGARAITLTTGVFITLTACLLDFLPAHWGIVGAIPRTFNAVTGPLGGLFLVGIFMPRVRERAALAATGIGLATSLLMGYLQQIGDLLARWGAASNSWPELSFTWIMPCSLLATLVAAPILGGLDRSPAKNVAGLTWRTRRESVNAD